MQITCPSCTSRYEIDAAKIGPQGRAVRCAGCQTRWHVAAAEAVAVAAKDDGGTTAFPAMPDPDETAGLLEDELRRAALAAEMEERAEAAAPAAPVAGPAPQARPRVAGGKPRKLRLPSLSVLRQPGALALIGLALLGLALWQRAPLVRAAPQLAGLFETLGLPVNLRALKLSGIEAELVEDAQGRFLVVRGDVTNLARGSNAVPLLALAVKDANGRTLYSWTTEAPRKQLAPAELVHFRARLSSPPEGGASIQVRFAADAA